MNKGILKDYIAKSRKEMIVEARRMLREITNHIIKECGNVEKGKDYASNVIANNVIYIKELTSVIVSLDARLQVIENELRIT